jgi:hypothetical protein
VRVMRRRADDRPTHLIAKPGDQKALCGLKDPLPVVWTEAAQAHIDGHGMVVCPECRVKWDG